MGLLDRFLDAVSRHATPSSTPIPESDIAIHTDTIAHLKDYLRTVPEKKAIVFSATPDYPRLLTLIDIDLVDANVADDDATKLKKDLAATGAIMHRIQHVDTLENSLRYTENKYDYLHQLMKELRTTLNAELRICRSLIAIGTTGGDKSLVLALRAQIKVEERIARELDAFTQLGGFETMFIQMLTCAQAVRQLDATERTMLKRIEHIIPHDVMARQGAPPGITRRFEYQWVKTVFGAMWEAMQEAESKGEIASHRHIEREFVNSAAFAAVAERVYYDMRPGPPSPISRAYINALISYFRKGFNDIDVA
jgi:hypothetical protein